jgi:hypothetical protein
MVSPAVHPWPRAAWRKFPSLLPLLIPPLPPLPPARPPSLLPLPSRLLAGLLACLLAHRYESAAAFGHSNAASILDARARVVAAAAAAAAAVAAATTATTNSSDKDMVAEAVAAETVDGAVLENAEARWWGVHLGDVLATVDAFSSSSSRSSGSGGGGLTLSSHVGHPLRTRPDPFTSGPGCHFSVATVALTTITTPPPTTTSTTIGARGDSRDTSSSGGGGSGGGDSIGGGGGGGGNNGTTTTNDDAAAGATEVVVESCELLRLDGCAQHVLLDAAVQAAVRNECKRRAAATASTASTAGGSSAEAPRHGQQKLLQQPPHQQQGRRRRETFRHYFDHRLDFTVKVDDGALQRTLRIGRADDPWAVAAVACQVRFLLFLLLECRASLPRLVCSILWWCVFQLPLVAVCVGV